MVLNIAQSLAAGPAQTLPGVGYRASASGDFNGDGFIDLAIATEGGAGTLIYPNIIDTGTPGGTKRALAAEPIPLGDAGISTGIAVADLDGDRALDLVIAKASGPSAAFRNPNDGTFGFVAATTAFGAAGDATHSVAAQDLNGDGRVDIVLGNTGPNRVFTNQGSWTFTPGRRARQRRQPRFRGRGFDRRQRARARVRERQPRRDGLCLRLCDAPLPGDATCERAGNVGGGRGLRRQRPRGPGVRPRASRRPCCSTRLHSALRCNSPRPSILALHRRPMSLRPTRTLTAMSTSSASMRPEATKSSRTTASASSRCDAEQFASAGARNATAAKLSVDDRVDIAVVGASGLEVFYNDGAGNFGRGDTGAPTHSVARSSVGLADG